MPPRRSTSSSASKRKRSTSTSKRKSSSCFTTSTVASRQLSTNANSNNNKQEIGERDPVYGHFAPQPDADGYYRYRHGRVHKMNRSLNSFILLPLIFMGFGNGYFMNLLILLANFFLKNQRKFQFELDFTNPIHVVLTLSIGIFFTVFGYYFACRHVEKQFYDSEESRKQSEKWKCQPYNWLTEEQRQQEIFWGCFNAGLGSLMGVSIFIYQQLPSTSEGSVKIYYDLQDPLYHKYWRTDLLGGWPTYIVTTVLYFLLADLWAYISHRILHWPLLYKHIHKFHHSFKAVSPFGAYALAIPEFIFITIGFQGLVFFIPMHFSALMINLLYLGYHAVLDHSGVDFDGWFAFSPSTMYHDNHHLLFHCNFGQSLVLWDWLGGTLRKDGRRYGATNFHDK